MTKTIEQFKQSVLSLVHERFQYELMCSCSKISTGFLTKFGYFEVSANFDLTCWKAAFGDKSNKDGYCEGFGNSCLEALEKLDIDAYRVWGEKAKRADLLIWRQLL